MKHGTKTSALIVICIMGVIATGCTWMMYDLIKQIPLLPTKIDKDVVIVYVAQIGALASIGGTALGILGGVLSSTEKATPPNPPADQPPLS